MPALPSGETRASVPWVWGDYVGGIALDPQGPATGSDRVIRGDGWGRFVG